MASDDDTIQIKADGCVVGRFSYKQRKKYKHLFKLSGIELINLSTCEAINKNFIYEDSLEKED